METFDIGIVKREPLEEFHNDNTYFDHMMSYNNDVFDSSVDWLSSFVDERSSAQTLDQLTPLSDYSNIVLTPVNRDQTLNRLNEINMVQRTPGTDEIPTQPTFSLYANSPVSPEFDHRLEGGSHELDYEMKSFYSGQQFYGQTFNHGENGTDCTNGMDKMATLKHDMTVSAKVEEDTRSSGESDHEREGSESGERETNAEELSMKCEYLDLKSCYDSGAHSPNSDTPGTPPQCLMLNQSDRDRRSFSSGEVTPPGEQPKHRQPFFLSEEEKRTLITEGLPIPSGYPLTKSEERALKKVRRKIKNKISAQESRRKKKEYMETLEKRVEICSAENIDLRKRLESMDTTNRTLISQLQKLQAVVASRVSRPTCSNSTQTTEKASS